MIGSTVSRYRILERLGGGGMGVVYKAEDLKLGRPVALKFLSLHRSDSEADRKRFLREARAASALDHANICTIFEIDESGDGRLFIAMAFCEGETLKRKIGRRGPLSMEEAVSYAAQVAAGLCRAHERGIVHRDVKPANLIVTPDGLVKIVDFGIAHLEGQTRLTRPGAAVGTAAYMPPEVFRGEALDARADVWSLGIVLYEMLTGEVPFQGETDLQVIEGILHRSPVPLATVRPGLPDALQRILERALAKAADDRYPHMEEMRYDLLQIQDPDLASDPTLVEMRSSSSSGNSRPRLPSLPSLSSADASLVGRTLGPYRILEQLGGGGMGVVYKAEDTRLERVVALKFLPPELSRDPEAKARFFQEARAASALDHPNVCTIHEAGEAGEVGSGRLYLAMACYDGETLRTRLKRGALPIEEAVDTALQIARGLAKAHRQGIVHRDVKPANLMVTSDEVVKILDFGLAKLAGAVAITRSGTSMGTPAYMSPEQARGDEVDARTDVWSLGVVLYEMLAGKRPFRGERDQAVLYGLLHEEPEALSRIRPEVPSDLERIVDRMLQKDPERRQATMAEVVAELQAHRGTASETVTRAMRRPRPGRWKKTGLAALAALAVAGGGYGLFRLTGGGARPDPDPSHGFLQQLTDQGGSESFPSLSPTGDFFVYAKADGNDVDIYLQKIGEGNPLNLTADSPLPDTHPAYSPDGDTIVFRSEREGGGLFSMGTTGGPARRVSDFGFNPSWSPDGNSVVCSTQPANNPGARTDYGQLWRIDVTTGQKQRLTEEGDAVQPSWSPNGWRIAYWGVHPETAQRVLWTIPADPAEASPPPPPLRPLRVTAEDDRYLNWNPVWSPDGRHLYFASDRNGSMNLWRVAIDERSGEVRGAPEQVTNSPQPSSLLSLSRFDGRILFATQSGEANLYRVELDAAAAADDDAAGAGVRPRGPLVPVTGGSRPVSFGDVSPDGKWVVFNTGAPQEDLFRVSADHPGDLLRLTDDPAKDRVPRWSPQGGRIAFYSDRSGRYELWSLNPEGSDLQPLVRSGDEETLLSPVWSPDGQRLACSRSLRETVLVDLTVPIERRVPRPLPVRSGRQERFGPTSWSPDGRWLAGTAAEPGIVVYSFERQRFDRLTDYGLNPVWLHDSRTLLFLDRGRVLTLDTRTLRTREVLAPTDNATFSGINLSPDQKRLYVVRSTNEGDIWMLTFEGTAQ